MSIQGRGIDIDTGFTKPIASGDYPVDTSDNPAGEILRGFSSVYLSGTVSLVKDVATIIGFDVEAYDPDNLHDNSVNNERLTVPAKWKDYVLMLGARVGVDVRNSDGMVGQIKHFNASGVVQTHVGVFNIRSGDSVNNRLIFNFYSHPVVAATGDYFSLRVTNAAPTTNLLTGIDGTAFWIETLGKIE